MALSNHFQNESFNISSPQSNEIFLELSFQCGMNRHEAVANQTTRSAGAQRALPLVQVRAFEAVARHLSFSTAAQEAPQLTFTPRTKIWKPDIRQPKWLLKMEVVSAREPNVAITCLAASPLAFSPEIANAP
jgi:hypothetical protein